MVQAHSAIDADVFSFPWRADPTPPRDSVCCGLLPGAEPAHPGQPKMPYMPVHAVSALDVHPEAPPMFAPWRPR